VISVAEIRSQWSDVTTENLREHSFASVHQLGDSLSMYEWRSQNHRTAKAKDTAALCRETTAITITRATFSVTKVTLIGFFCESFAS